MLSLLVVEPLTDGTYLLCQRVCPSCLERIAGTGIVGRVVAWRTNGVGFDKLAVDSLVQCRPSFSTRPVFVARQGKTLFVWVLSSYQLRQEHSPDELCNVKKLHLAESLERIQVGIQPVVMIPRRQDSLAASYIVSNCPLSVFHNLATDYCDAMSPFRRPSRRRTFRSSRKERFEGLLPLVE